MNSNEFLHGAYVIKTFQRDGLCRARAFHNGVWLHEVSDWSCDSLEDAVRRMRASLDALDDAPDEADNDVQSYHQTFHKLWSPPAIAPDARTADV